MFHDLLTILNLGYIKLNIAWLNWISKVIHGMESLLQNYCLCPNVAIISSIHPKFLPWCWVIINSYDLLFYLNHSFKQASKTPHIQNRSLNPCTLPYTQMCTHMGAFLFPLSGFPVFIDDAITCTVAQSRWLSRSSDLPCLVLPSHSAPAGFSFWDLCEASFWSLKTWHQCYFLWEILPITLHHITLVSSLFSSFLGIFLFICCLSFSHIVCKLHKNRSLLAPLRIVPVWQVLDTQ